MSSRLISVPLTTAHTSGGWCSDALQPPKAENTSPARGRSAPARRSSAALLEVLREKIKVCSGRFFHTAQANTGRAHANLFADARNHGAHFLKIGIPAATPGIVGVADHVPIVRPFAADVTLQCHNVSCTPKD